MNSSVSQLRGKVVVAGHIALDVIPEFPEGARLPAPGTLVEVGPAVITTGGSVANTGLALHKLGVPVRLVALAGEDLFGHGIRAVLAASGAEVRLRCRAGLATSYSLVLMPRGTDRGFLHAPGANHEFDPDEVTEADLDGAVALHFGYPTLMRRVYSDGGAALGRLFARARRRGMVTSLDTAFPDGEALKVDWLDFMRRVLPEVSLFCPSVDELRILFKRDAATSVAALAKEALEMGAAAVAIKCGSDGLYLASTGDAALLKAAGLPGTWRGVKSHAPCFVVEMVSATGAGDCTIAGLLTAALLGHDVAETLMLATAVGGFSVEAVDATGGIKPWGEVLARIAGGWKRRS